MSREPTIRCPHCDSSAKVRSSHGITPVYREIYYQCSDVECSHAWVACLQILRTISQAARPNPRIHLPFVPAPRRRDRTPDAANDDAPLATPATASG